MNRAIDPEELAKALCDRFPLGLPYTAYREDAAAIIAALGRAPQAQEETRGAPAAAHDAFCRKTLRCTLPPGHDYSCWPSEDPAPAPASQWSKDNPCPWCKSCGQPTKYHKPGMYASGSDGKPCTEFVPWEYPEPKPPAPASPAGLVWTKEKPTREGYYWVRCDSLTPSVVEIAEIAGVWYAFYTDQSEQHLRKFGEAYEWAGPIPEPAHPEAGAPGTQRPSTIEAAAMLAEAIRRAGTQEGGSQP